MSPLAVRQPVLAGRIAKKYEDVQRTCETLLAEVSAFTQKVQEAKNTDLSDDQRRKMQKEIEEGRPEIVLKRWRARRMRRSLPLLAAKLA